MIHAPLRGLFFLSRAALLVAAAAALPYLLRRNKALADQIGDSLIKAGEKIKNTPTEGADAHPQASAAPKAPAATGSPKKPAPKAAPKPVSPAANP